MPTLATALEEIEGKTTLADQVKAVVMRRLASGKPELADIARELGASERSLQRRIAETGTTFRQLLEEARQELGRQVLANGQNGIGEVAVLLGYQDTSAVYRAFRDWEGMTPAEWRRLN